MRKITKVVIVILFVSVVFSFFYLTDEVESKVINLDEGIYTDPIQLEVYGDIVIRGKGVDVSILKPNFIPPFCYIPIGCDYSDSDTRFGIWITAQQGSESTAIIEDLTIDMSNGDWYTRGLILANFKSVLVRNVKFEGGGNAGVGNIIGKNWHISDCTYDGFNDEAIVFFGGSTYSTISNCDFSYSYPRGVLRPATFMEMISTSYNTITDCSFDNAPQGISIAGCNSHDNLIQRCEFSNFDEAAVYIFMGSLPDCPNQPNYNNHVEDCTFVNCADDISYWYG